MKNSEERRKSDASPEERDEEGIGPDTFGRGAPIDEDVAGELNAALPEEGLDDKAEGDGGARAA
jgi:hypothetical protein